MANAQTAAETGDNQPSRAQQLMGDADPKLAELTDKVLFGECGNVPALRNATAASSPLPR